MMRIIIVVFILVLIPQQVFAYCYSLDPVTYNNCIQRENYINQMKQMQQQQIFMQNLQMEQQRQMHKQQMEMQKKMMQQQMFNNMLMYPAHQSQQNYDYCSSGSLEIDYEQYRAGAMMGRNPGTMTKEEFAKAHKYCN